MFKAVLFDLDNTLCDIVFARVRYLQDVTRTAGLKPDDSTIRQVAEEGWEAIVAFLDSISGVDVPGKEYSFGIAQCVESCFESRRVVREITHRMRAGVITNGRERAQREKLRRCLGDENVFPVVISSAVGFRKPDVRIFEYALQQLDLPGSDVLFVGDDPVDDMLGASRAGLHTCWLSHGRPMDCLPCEVDFVIEHLDEVLEVSHAACS